MLQCFWKACLFRERKGRLSSPNYSDTKQNPHLYGNAEKSEVANTVLSGEGKVSENQWQPVWEKCNKSFERSGFVSGSWGQVWSLWCLKFKIWALEGCHSLSVGTGRVTLVYTENCFHVIWRNMVFWRFTYPQSNLSDVGPAFQHVQKSLTLTQKGKMSDHIKPHFINKPG